MCLGYPLFLLVQWGYQSYLQSHIGQFQYNKAQEALLYLRNDFYQRQRILHQHALVLKKGLYEQNPQVALGRISPDKYSGIEWYNTHKTLMGWRGLYASLDTTTAFPKFQKSHIITQVDTDILETWMPIEQQNKPLGYIRLLQLIRRDAPFENADNVGFALAEEWQKRTELPVEVDWTNKKAIQFEGSDTVLLKDLSGQPLGRAKVLLPTDVDLLSRLAIKWQNIYAFWTFLMWLWLLFGLWKFNDHQLAQYKARKGNRWLLSLGILGFPLLLIAGRYGLLKADLPRKWFIDYPAWEKLFDPTLLATEYGFGSARSVGDLILTGIFCMIFALFVAHITHRIFHRFSTIKVFLRQLYRSWEEHFSSALLYGIWASTLLLVIGLTLCFPLVLQIATQRLVHDSVLNYFDWTGLTPSFLISAVYIGMFLLGGSFVILNGTLLWVVYLCLAEWRMMRSPLHSGIVILLFGLTWWIFFSAQLHFLSALYFVFLLFGFVYSIEQRTNNRFFFFTVRGLLFLLTTLTLLLYPLLYNALETQKSSRMLALADLYSIDPAEGINFTLNRFSADLGLTNTLIQEGKFNPEEANALLHQLAIELNTLQSESFEVSLSRLDAGGNVLEHFVKSSAITDRSLLSDTHAIRGGNIVKAFMDGKAASTENNGHANAIYQRINSLGNDYILFRAMPQKYAMRDVIPKYDAWQSQFSATVFEDGKRIRSIGEDFEKDRLPLYLRKQIQSARQLTVNEQLYGVAYVTLYQQSNKKTIAIRTRAVQATDHLYQMMRMYWAGLLLAFPLYLLGIFLRKKSGMLPLPQSNFKDKVLDAFLAVGVLTAFVMGFVANSAIGYTNQGSLRGNLQNRLGRMEMKLPLSSANSPAEALENLIEKNQLDSLSTQIGLDLHVYQRATLIRTTRPDLVNDRLISGRLPLSAYQNIFHNAQRQAFVSDQPNERVLPYTVGYTALADSLGNPKYVFAALAVAEEDRIREESARTSAYLFTALLLLILAVLGTTTIVATLLTQPLRRLRAGLEQVAEGNFEKELPVESQDEFGELVRTFNMMQHQLAFSQKRLAEQERRLAWNEMARQVAHEIKNPLTPMKLSVQHLQRAYKDAQENPVASDEKMRKMFGRVTQTLIEQIETLNNIANEFSNFARLPQTLPKINDLNEIIDEAYRLQEAYDAVEIISTLSEAPLPVLVDRENMRRIFINLIKNGAQAMDQGGCIILKSEKIETDGKWFAVAYVTDNGSGIPAEIKDKIFQPNFSTKTSGMGLGLAIVKKTIQEAGGIIDFETEEGLGTTFRIILPLQKDTEKVEMNAEKALSSEG